MDNLLGEFFGTMILITFGCGNVANMNLNKSKAQGGGWVCLAFGWGFAVMMGAFTSITLGAPQADLNPAITLVKTFMGVYTVPQFFATSAIQILGAIVGSVLVYLLFLSHWKETEDKTVKLCVFATKPAIRDKFANFLNEFLGTAILMFGIWMIVVGRFGVNVPADYVPFFIGLLIAALTFSFGGPTGLALNPARDFGPRIAHAILPIADKGDSDWAYSWIPIVAPCCGALTAYFLAKILGVV